MIIDYVADVLKDGKWHYVRTIARKLDQPEPKIRGVLDFCVSFNMATVDSTGNRVKLDPALAKLLK